MDYIWVGVISTYPNYLDEVRATQYEHSTKEFPNKLADISNNFVDNKLFNIFFLS